MSEPSNHPIVTIITEGILKELDAIRKAGHCRAAIILLYCGIDQISFLARRPDCNSGRAAFVSWVEQYLKLEGDTTVTGMELYAARCAQVHKYGSVAELHTDGKVSRQVIHGGGLPKAVIFQPGQNLVLVDTDYAIDKFIDGTMEFFRDVVEGDPAYRELVNERLHTMNDVVPARDAVEPRK